MTADAKVGLLLGLLFIIVIAFLINGLPTVLQSAGADDVVPTTSIVAPSGPDLVIDHRVTQTAQRLSPDVPLRVSAPPQEVIVLDSAPQAALPTTVEPIAPTTTPAAIAEQVSQLPAPPATPTHSTPDERIHTVQRGETLASIAQHYYGPEAGNRRAVIRKLYEANSDILSSPDRVVVGNRLTIPPLKTNDAVAATPSASEGLLQKFSAFFERTGVQAQGRQPASTPRTAEYIVQPGDSLWKIAEKTLGDGHKFNILAELNEDRLKSPNDVVVGMTLIVPVP